SGIPGRVLFHFEKELHRERMLMSVLDEELRRVVSVLGEARIQCAVIGGMDLAHRYYPERMGRPTEKAELLVRPGSYGSALRVLGREGFRSISGRRISDGTGTALSRQPHGPVIEVRSRLLDGDDDGRVEGVWERGQVATLGGTSSLVRFL